MIPTRIGQECHGGTFTGFNRINTRVYGIIVAPKHTEVRLQWKQTSNFLGPNSSLHDGFFNTQLRNCSDYPAAYYTARLDTNGYNDWYLPSSSELLQISQTLFPSERKPWNVDSVSYTACSLHQHLIPQEPLYGSNVTIVTRFSIPTESFDRIRCYWSSTHFSYNSALFIRTADRHLYSELVREEMAVRPVRREVIASK